MSKKVSKTPSLTPEEKERRRIRARMRFKAIVRLVMENIDWLQDTGDFKISDNVMKNIQLLTRKKTKTSSLTLQEKSILKKRKEDRTEEDKQILNRAIGGLRCFRRYPPNVKAQLAAVTYFCFYKPGLQIVKQGHKAHAMYFMLSGEAAVTVTREDKVLKETIAEDSGVIEPGTMFGEVALIHEICRLATITTITPCELLMITKEDFDIVLKDTVMKAWDEIQRILNKFSYFKNWDSLVKRECSIMSRTKVFAPEETVLGDGSGLPDYVYFITKGSCCIIEHMKLRVSYANGVKKYRLLINKKPDDNLKSVLTSEDLERKWRSKSRVTLTRRVVGKSSIEAGNTGDKNKRFPKVVGSILKSSSGHEVHRKSENGNRITIKVPKSSSSKQSKPRLTSKEDFSLIRSPSKYLRSVSCFDCSTDPPDIETHFVKVCDLLEGACFSIGENFVNRRVVAKAPTNCLLVPRYWILRNNKDNIWNRVQQFLNQHIPNTEKIFKNFLQEQKFIKYRKSLIRDLLREKRIPNNNSIHNVPYSIRLKEGVDVDYGI